MSFENLTLEQMENMSDEDFAKLNFSDIPENENFVEEVAEVETPAEEVPVEQPTPTEPEHVDEAVPNEAAAVGEGTHAGTEPNEAGEAVQPTEQTQEATPVEVTAEKSFFDKVTAEFQANGKAFKIDSADDVVSLMQKGLNYNQKMATMKPGMKVLKALQEQGIESVEDLGYLLDLKAGKPEAIAKLIKDTGIDAYDLNEDKAQAYQPTVPQVSDELINFEMHANALEGNPHFGTVVNELRGFDEATRTEIFKNPHLLNLLTDHVQNGYYDKIRARLDHEQAVGRLNGMSFLQAYDTVGGILFGQPTQEAAPVAAPIAQAVAVASKAKPSNNAARTAAAGTTSTSATVQKLTFTPEELWNMSEEDFKKIDPKFLN